MSLRLLFLCCQGEAALHNLFFFFSSPSCLSFYDETEAVESVKTGPHFMHQIVKILEGAKVNALGTLVNVSPAVSLSHMLHATNKLLQDVHSADALAAHRSVLASLEEQSHIEF